MDFIFYSQFLSFVVMALFFQPAVCSQDFRLSGLKSLFLYKTSLMTNTGWNHDEFVCFLLIYTSHVDMEFSDEEKASKKQFSPEIFNRQYALFESMNDYQALDTILQYKSQYFESEEQKQQLLDTIRSQFFADGEFSDFWKGDLQLSGKNALIR